MAEVEPGGSSGNTPIINNVERDFRNQHQRQSERNRNGFNPRDRLFHALFVKISNIYSRLIPKRFRLIIETVVLVKGLLLFTFLSYLHFSFGHHPMNCLNTTIQTWPRDGILRVQIQPEYELKILLPRFYSPESRTVLFHPCHLETNYYPKICYKMSVEFKNFYDSKCAQYSLRDQTYRANLSDFLYSRNFKGWKLYQDFEYIAYDHSGSPITGFEPGEITKEGRLFSFYDKYLTEKSDMGRPYIFEYSREFGFLRLSPETRTRLKVPIKIVSLDPNKEKCFGDSFSRFLLKYFLGYDDILMNSIKKVADAENNSGYMLNVVTGDHYKFVPWGIGKGSYVISLFLMFLFTISISTLLRYCHQQVFFFIIHVLQMLDMNVVFAFPVAPLFTVVLSLVGMETIMSEYFNDTTTSFYIILIVWAVDQFDTICCHTEITQKYWLRFFYLYHFLFYAYHYRFNGQYSSLALAATWFMIQHSMLYFFHNYELPAVESNRNNTQEDHEEEAYLDEAVQMIVEGLEFVAGQQDQHEQRTTPPPSSNSDSNVSVSNESAQNNVDRRVREISTGVDGVNRIFIFAADRPFLQMVRDFIRHIHERMNRENTESHPASNVDTQTRDEEAIDQVTIVDTTSHSVEPNGLESDPESNTSCTTEPSTVSNSFDTNSLTSVVCNDSKSTYIQIRKTDNAEIPGCSGEKEKSDSPSSAANECGGDSRMYINDSLKDLNVETNAEESENKCNACDEKAVSEAAQTVPENYINLTQPTTSDIFND